MNAKKIMGAVLVALLAAALFIGAGAAVEDKGTYFAYQAGTGLSEGVWQNGANTVTVNAAGNVSDVIVAGIYTKGDLSAYFTKPTATYSAVGEYNGKEYIVVNGGNVYAGSNLTIDITSLNVTNNQIRIELPDGSVEFNETAEFTDVKEAGIYKVQAVWNETVNGFVAGAPLPAVDANVFTFTVVKPEDATISGSVDKIIAGEVISITVKGTPGVKYTLGLTGINASAQNVNQIVKLNVDGKNLNFTMPNIGEVTFQITTDANEDEVKVELTAEGSDKVIGEVEIAVTKPEVTATLGAPSYFIGNDIEVILSSTGKLGSESDYSFTIDGTNIDETGLTNAEDAEKKDGKLIYKLNNDSLKLDVGTYTIAVKFGGNKVVATLPVALKQPFISIAKAPEVVVQNKSATFLINAEATNAIQAYIFGTNMFIPVLNGSEFIDYEEDEEGKDILNLFNVTLDAETTNGMATGQYFAVFQHPMYDGDFNINATEAGAFYLNTSATATETYGQYLFNAKDRQTANAAQALCDALDSQNIDDMYVKASFFVVSTVDKDTFSISEIPTTVAQGETITITGVATEYAEGTPVVVEMVSTAFAAVPKETVGSAAFILATTEIAEDGTWEITLDTTGLNIDEYNLAVKIATELKESVTVNVVEADEPVNPEQPEEPEQPEQPEEPVAPATPGFGALAALAGLGAVAVLLLRRE